MNSNLRKLFNPTYLAELFVIIFLTTFIFLISAHFDASEHIFNWLKTYELYELDEVLQVSPVWIFLMISVFCISFQRYSELSRTNRELRLRNKMIQKAMSEIKQLRGIIPICSNCKKIRDDEGYWNQVEQYVSVHSGAKFSHGICPDCARKHYNYIDDKGDTIKY